MIKRIVQWAARWHRKSPHERYLWLYRIGSVRAGLISLVPLRLPWLLNHFGSDKHRPGWHRYGDIYQALFRPLKYRPIRMLEIGIGGYGESLGGTSLLAWQAFFPRGTIFGADIKDKTALAGKRRHVVILDQSSQPQLDELKDRLGPFDIVIDDGSHMNAHQILTFERLFDAVREEGVYVIEDIQTSFWPGVIANVTWDGAGINAPRFGETCYGYFLELAKYLNQAEFPDRTGLDPRMAAFARQIRGIGFHRNMIVIQKGRNDDPSIFVASSSTE